jgi:hypothetical protein
MAGALMQLVAYGAQNVYLNSKPEISFFKAVYRRHTNFAMESMEQTLSGSPDLGASTLCRVSRNGDLMGATYVEMTTTGATVDTSGARVGFNLLRQVELRVGGQMIDRQSGLWMWLWTELTHTANQKAQLTRICGANGGLSASGTTLYVPLQFAFCRNPGLALPLIALQYHEVELAIDFASVADASGVTALSNVSVWVDYIFLDTEERKTFAQNPHEYLIETVQTVDDTVSSATNTDTNIRLTFNHPVKELVWVNRSDVGASNSILNSDLTDAILRLNGQDRFKRRNAQYFNYVQPYQHHTGKPVSGIYCYSFGLKPEEHQPSGTCNFSRIDNANLVVKYGATGASDAITIFAHGYNVLRVASGMGGLAYSN